MINADGVTVVTHWPPKIFWNYCDWTYLRHCTQLLPKYSISLPWTEWFRRDDFSYMGHTFYYASIRSQIACAVTFRISYSRQRDLTFYWILVLKRRFGSSCAHRGIVYYHFETRNYGRLDKAVNLKTKQNQDSSPVSGKLFFLASERLRKARLEISESDIVRQEKAA